jgi:acetolactate synthase regulatory subunit
MDDSQQADVRLALKEDRSVSALVQDLLKVRLRDQP